MSISVTHLGDSGADYASSSGRATLSQPYTLSGSEGYVLVIVSSSGNPDFDSATIDSVDMDVLGLVESNGRLQVFALDLRLNPISTTGNIVISASSSASNRSFVAWFGIEGVPVGGMVASPISAGSLGVGISPTTEGSALVIGGEYQYISGADMLSESPTGASVVFADGGNGSANQGIIGVCRRDATSGYIEWGHTDSYQVLDLRESVPAYQAWPRGGNVYAQP